MQRLLSVWICVFLAVPCGARVITVDDDGPADFNNIQAAIDVAEDDDRIVVAPGTYYENIDFEDKSITVASTAPNDPNVVAGTVITAGGLGTVVTFPDTAGAKCVLAGFTITGGNSPAEGGGICCRRGNIAITHCTITDNAAETYGGGIYNNDSDLTLTDCTLSGNLADWGGGIDNRQGNLGLTDCIFSGNSASFGDGGGIRNAFGRVTMVGCTFSENSAGNDGGGIGSDYNSVALVNCSFSGNSAGFRGGGMANSHYGATATNCTFSGNTAVNGGGISTFMLYSGDLSLTNCTFCGNTADSYGGAVFNEMESNLTLTNCVLWGNSANEGPQMALQWLGTASVSYSCLQGAQWDVYTGQESTLKWLEGNIDADPCFVDDADGDYHLRSSAGRWDPNQNDWIFDANTSRCIDAGNPGSPLGGELLTIPGDRGHIWGENLRINMGAYGGTPQASMPPYDWALLADITNDGIVNGRDFAHQADDWLINAAEQPGDLNRNGIVDTNDVGLFVDDWLKTTSWYE